MEYKSKYKASEIDARLSQVFDSTLQTKEVEVSGNTTIKADEGFLGLKEVSVKVTGGGGTAPSSFEYLDITNVTGMWGQLKILLLQMAYMGKVPQTVIVDGVTLEQGITPASGYMTMIGSFMPSTEEFTQATNAITAISIDFSSIINMQGQVLTIQEVFAMYGLQADIDAIPRLTEEEFYAL